MARGRGARGPRFGMSSATTSPVEIFVDPNIKRPFEDLPPRIQPRVQAPTYSPVTAPPVSVPNYSPVAGLTPEILDALNLRKEAVDATKSATDQYEADVADFKNIMAKEAEQGIASLPATTNKNPGVNSITYDPNISLPFQRFDDPRDFIEDIYHEERPPSGPRIENPIINSPLSIDSNLVRSIREDPRKNENVIRYNPFYVDDEGNMQRYKGPDRKFIGEKRPPSIEEEIPFFDGIVRIPETDEMMSGEPSFIIGNDGKWSPSDYLNSGMGNPDNLSIEELIRIANIESGDVQVPYNTGPKQSTPGNFYRGIFQGGTKTVGPTRGRGRGPGTGGQGPYNPPPVVTPPPPPPSSGGILDVIRKPKMYERPTSFESGAPTLVKAMSPQSFGTAPGFEPASIPPPRRIPLPPKRPPRTLIDDQIPPKAKGGMYLGDSFLNKGLSQLPMNGQNDTLTTQVFQAGFRPRR